MNPMRLAVAAITAATLIALFVVARQDDDESRAETTAAITRTEPPEAEPIEPTTTAETETEPVGPEPVRLVVNVRGGRPADGIVRAEAKKDDRILLVVRSDIADRVHVHGYNLVADVGPGRPSRMQFRATLTGRFEIELEDSHVQIAQLTVLP